MSLTDKQRAILEKAGHNPDDYSDKKASELIGEILAKRSNSLQAREKQASQHRNDSSFYVAYSKDLLIAMIGHAAQTKNENFDIITAANLAVQIVQGMKAQFSAD